MAEKQSALFQKERIISRDTIETLIAEGRKIIIVDGKVLKVDAWLPYHPGGDKAILHMVGRDATDEVHVYVTLLVLRLWTSSDMFPVCIRVKHLSV